MERESRDLPGGCLSSLPRLALPHLQRLGFLAFTSFIHIHSCVALLRTEGRKDGGEDWVELMGGLSFFAILSADKPLQLHTEKKERLGGV